MKYTKKKRFVELENINEKEISMKKDLFEGTEQTQKVVAKAKKHKVLKKALVTLGFISAIGACVFLTACNKKGNDKTTNGITPPTTQQGEQTSGNQGSQENQGGQTGGNQGGNQGSQENQGGNQGEQTGGNQGGQETGGNQGGQTGGETGGNQGGETNPEKPADKTPAEYKAECEQKIVDKVTEYFSTKYKRGKISNVELVKMNLENGNIYVTADYTIGSAVKNFYKVESDLGNMTQKSYKSISQSLDTVQLSTIEKSTIMNASELGDKYNALCNYVLGQYDLQDSEVLNVTKFSTMSDMGGTILTVLYGDKIYSVEARCHSPTNDANTCIDLMLASETNEFELRSQEEFKDFDNIVSAEAGISSYKVKLGGKTLFSETNGNIVYNNDLGMGM